MGGDVAELARAVSLRGDQFALAYDHRPDRHFAAHPGRLGFPQR
jgi:hypothetical protein